MKFRPRYSLLTLLILTALVAGGVKLWHGPHHAVERPAADREVEYSYVRDWRGNRIFQGPRVARVINDDGTLRYSHLCLYRQGQFVPQSIGFIYQKLKRPARPLQFRANLDPGEQQEYEQVIEREFQRYNEQGTKTAGLSWKPDDIGSYQYILHLK